MNEEYILSYGFLDTSGQRDIEDFVARHPEYTELLTEARALFAAHLAERASPSDAELAARLVDDRLGVRDLASSDPEDPLIAQRHEAMEARLDAFQPVADPVARFEQLSGRSLPAMAHAYARDRSPAAPRLTPLRRRLFTGVALLVLFTAVAIPSLRLRAIDRLAFMSDSELQLDGYAEVLRGEQPTTAEIPADQLYRYALSAFKYARNPGMGLFPWYDPGELARAESLLRRVIEEEPATSFLGQEARNTLAHVLLAQSKREEAQQLLREVAAGSSRHAARASELLNRLAP